MKSAVLFLVFNRPNTTKQVFESIRKAKPPRLYVAADGPRKERPGEKEKCEEVRRIASEIDWNCKVLTLFRENNYGCKKAVSTAIDWFFEYEDMGIIIEDDCDPTSVFFEFCEWGLNKFKNQKQVGIISGSNLIDYKYKSLHRNGYSNYINIWAWGTWKDRWLMYNSSYSLTDICYIDKKIKKLKWLFPLERFYWKNIFKHTFTYQTTWDFYLQYLFFDKNLLSVFPGNNLVRNLGYDGEGTHTNLKPPEFCVRSMPKGYDDIMNKPVLIPFYVDEDRDHDIMKIIWGCGYYSAVKLYLMNILRYIWV